MGDLVQIKVGHDKYINGIVTRRDSKHKIAVIVRCNFNDREVEYKMIEKYLYTLNKKCSSIV